ncbi:MAG: cobalt-precorrin-5B (C(1))-methyltransferase [Beijerinckiaceae bacterium]|jgi:cobalt-precorrin-5B (C1)-methyltransferase
MTPDDPPNPTSLRRGWTTGACAAAGARAACEALLTGHFPASVEIPLPGGQRPSFALASEKLGTGFAEAGIVKDAGDDPDVTHGALVVTRVARAKPGEGLVFRAGEGVGTVTRPGLPLAVGEPAINPGPRGMIKAALAEVLGAPADLTVTISIPGGEKIAKHTLNARLGIIGGLSILGTTGIVIPFSCAAWIDTIHRGVDVARAMGLPHIAAATGTTSEKAVQALYGLPEPALIEMGDFAGGLLKYLRKHPVEQVTIAGGFAKMVKLGQGLLDLHSGRGTVDLAWLAARATEAGASPALARKIAAANTAADALHQAKAENIDVAARVAEAAWATAAKALKGSPVKLDIAIFDREGILLARTPARDVGAAS